MNRTPNEGTTDTTPTTDPFDTLLSLEEDYYTEGHALGLNDGIRSGRIEGRLFGLEKGFDKFIQMGQLAGRAAVWKGRLPDQSTCKAVNPTVPEAHCVIQLPSLSGSERLRRHIARLDELTEAASLETKNSEEAVNECDERLAGAKAKFLLISRIAGENDREVAEKGVDVNVGGELGDGAAEMDVATLKTNEVGGAKTSTARVKGEMEDFVGLPHVAKKAGGGV
ncbi:hypothetical protein LTR62_007409 [Meristemomyces frigidus]|uniref:Essential protein Yae1 N-terminal domain-containing protein n=1 Tax=Meristemomyces frigidus TaxID=1508187 RepID=A0AAN7YMH4_9PEZI|nr:hypothetical protein LTR62_007409 [Meristemomyces frigidus]